MLHLTDYTKIFNRTSAYLQVCVTISALQRYTTIGLFVMVLKTLYIIIKVKSVLYWFYADDKDDGNTVGETGEQNGAKFPAESRVDFLQWAGLTDGMDATWYTQTLTEVDDLDIKDINAGNIVIGNIVKCE